MKPGVAILIGALFMVGLFLVSALAPPIVLIIALSATLLAAFLYLGLRAGRSES